MTLYNGRPQIAITTPGQLSLEGGAPPSTAPPSPVAAVREPVEFFRARDSSKFERELGRDDVRWVAVDGRVEEVDSAGSVTVLRFRGADDFTAVVMQGDYVEVAAGLGGEAKGTLDSLSGKDIRVLGYITSYRDSPQIKVTEPGQILLEWEEE